MAKFVINASGAMLLPSLIQVSESISGSVVPLAMFIIYKQGTVEKDYKSPEVLISIGFFIISDFVAFICSCCPLNPLLN